jgi:hypothetical protein
VKIELPLSFLAALFMSRVLQNFPLMFQRFHLSPGSSMQHGRDMLENIVVALRVAPT